MKAVLGFLFLLVGSTVAYLVLTGKLPTSNPSGLLAPATTSTTPSGSHVHSPGPSSPGSPNPVTPNGGVGGPISLGSPLGSGGPYSSIGLPTVGALNDLTASQGGMS